jgi:hypothetical protein
VHSLHHELKLARQEAPVLCPRMRSTFLDFKPRSTTFQLYKGALQTPPPLLNPPTSTHWGLSPHETERGPALRDQHAMDQAIGHQQREPALVLRT